MWDCHVLQVIYNAAAVYCQMEQWERARQILLSVSQGSQTTAIEEALDSVLVSVTTFRIE